MNDFRVKDTLFDDFADEVCKGISKRRRDEVKEELLYHLDENFELGIRFGMDEKEAALQAIEKMGDKAELSEKFKKVYENPFFAELRSSVNILAFGIIFYNVFLNIFGGAEVISKLIGAVLILYGLFRMRKTDRLIKASLYVFSFHLVFASFLKFLYCYGGINIEYLSYFSVPLWAISYILLFAGLSRISKGELQPDDKKPHILGLGTLWTLLLSFFGIFFSNEELYVVGYAFVALTVGLIVSLRTVKNIIGRRESEILVRQRLKGWERVACSLIIGLIIIALPLSAMICGYTRQPRYEEYNKNDIEISESDSEQLKAHLLDLGLPEERLNDLPISEIEQYKNAVSMQKQLAVVGDSDKKIEGYYFFLPRGEVRVLYCVLCDDEKSRRDLRDAFFYQFEPNQMIDLSSSSEDNKELNLILAQKDGKTYRCEPVDTATHSTYPTYYGCEFSFPHGSEKRRVYFASTGCICDSLQEQSVYIKRCYYHRTSPIGIVGVSFTQLSEKRFIDGIIEPNREFDGYWEYFVGTHFEYEPFETAERLE